MQRCLYHPFKRAVGYCHVCGMFGCGECLSEHDGAHYCGKHFKPIAERLARKKHLDKARHKPHRQRLVVHTRSGEVARGYCFHLDTQAPAFRLDCADMRGELLGEIAEFRFDDLKALFYVKSFDGHHKREEQQEAIRPSGEDVVVCFEDGEELRGKTLHPHKGNAPLFWLIPDDSASNVVRALIPAAAARAVYSPEEYARRETVRREEYMRKHVARGCIEEEALGDYYFAKHDYHRAEQYYETAAEKKPADAHIAKRLAATAFNIGVIHARDHDYEWALRCMERAQSFVPEHEKARHMAEKLRAKL